jgi:hypothetical protein
VSLVNEKRGGCIAVTASTPSPPILANWCSSNWRFCVGYDACRKLYLFIERMSWLGA